MADRKSEEWKENIRRGVTETWKKRRYKYTSICKPIARYVDVSCKRCRARVKLTETKAKKYWGGYCSKKCADDAKRTGLSVKKICLQCGKHFAVIPANAHQQYCSYACMGKVRRKPWVDFDLRLRHSKEYVEWRRAVLKRDKWECQKRGEYCTRYGNIAHHLKLWGTRPELRFVIENGKAVCRPCHASIHCKNLR